ncbi:hypothetical protein E2542_SST00548 [Spatholobus suberectus]|nr:hypothetical protein E2542_SST00548 [Spatholobus suberectus]
MYVSSINTQNQTETSQSATKKKSSKSRGAKNDSVDLHKEQLERTLGFLGAGGTCGNLWNPKLLILWCGTCTVGHINDLRTMHVHFLGRVFPNIFDREKEEQTEEELRGFRKKKKKK